MTLKRLAGVFVLALMMSWPLLAVAQTDEPATPTPVATVQPPAAATATPAGETIAATAEPAAPTRPPTHTILAGETLVTIATQYSVTVEALQLVNDIDNPELIFAGQVLVIPGELGDVVPTTYVVRVDDTLISIASRFNTSAAEIAAANRLPTADFLYGGQRLSLISRTGTPNPLESTGRPHVVLPGETIWDISLRAGLLVNEVRTANGLAENEPLFPGQRLRLPVADSPPFQPGLPGEWLSVSISPVAPRQGDTMVLTVVYGSAGTPTGRLIDPTGRAADLTFFPAAAENTFQALIGFDAFALPGRYTLQLAGSGPARPWFPLERALAVADVDFGLQAIILEDEFETLLDPQVREAEDLFLNDIFIASDSDPQWQGVFQQPVSNTFITAGYGSDRTYNGGPVDVFHSGIDFGGSTGTPILAPAAGQVVFVDNLELRGGTVIVDHGGGVMTAYYHLSEFFVTAGETVVPGQRLASGGSTGLSTGPHLHWDIRVWGAAVNPEPWLNRVFP